MTIEVKERVQKTEEEAKKEELKTCFIVMPISNADGYEPGHFNRVYDYIIKPACEAAGFKPSRADDTKHTNTIILDILNQIVKADMVVCDLSSKNPNVMYELGIRQAFNLPVVLMKDLATNRVFDTSSLRDIEYDHSLRIDTVRTAIGKISEALKETYEKKDSDTHSLISLLNIEAATLPVRKELSAETTLILEEIKALKSSYSYLTKVNNTTHISSAKLGRIGYGGQNGLELEEAFNQIYYGSSVVVNHTRFGKGEVVSLNKKDATVEVHFFNQNAVRDIEFPYTGIEILDITK